MLDNLIICAEQTIRLLRKRINWKQYKRRLEILWTIK